MDAVNGISRGFSWKPNIASKVSSSIHKNVSIGQKLALAAVASNGASNTSWDSKPNHHLLGKHSTWILFEVCTCFSAAVIPHLCHAQSISPQTTVRMKSDLTAGASHGKKVHTNYSVIGIPGDGRCLFRAVVHGACLRCGDPAPNERLQRELADELRHKVVDELVERREMSEWFIEGDFDAYTKRMRKCHEWGGEPELLMASHVLKMPISVYMYEESSEGLIPISEYGQEYGKQNPITVLYNGYGHYDALQLHD